MLKQIKKFISVLGTKVIEQIKDYGIIFFIPFIKWHLIKSLYFNNFWYLSKFNLGKRGVENWNLFFSFYFKIDCCHNQKIVKLLNFWYLLNLSSNELFPNNLNNLKYTFSSLPSRRQFIASGNSHSNKSRGRTDINLKHLLNVTQLNTVNIRNLGIIHFVHFLFVFRKILSTN